MLEFIRVGCLDLGVSSTVRNDSSSTIIMCKDKEGFRGLGFRI